MLRHSAVYRRILDWTAERLLERRTEERRARREDLKGDVSPNPKPNRFFVPCENYSCLLTLPPWSWRQGGCPRWTWFCPPPCTCRKESGRWRRRRSEPPSRLRC